MERVQISPCGFICERVTVACVAPFCAVLVAKNEEQESKTAGKMVQGLVSFLARSNRESRPSVFFCPETKGKRLLRRLMLANFRLKIRAV